MKKIFWTTIFWFVVIAGLAFYMKMYNLNLASQVCTWLGAPTSSGAVVVSQGDSMATIQTTLADMQSKLDQLLQGTSVQQPTLPTTGTGN